MVDEIFFGQPAVQAVRDAEAALSDARRATLKRPAWAKAWSRVGMVSSSGQNSTPSDPKSTRIYQQFLRLKIVSQGPKMNS